MRAALARTLMRLSHRGRLARFHELESNQWLSPEQLVELGETRLVSLLAAACREVPFYRDFAGQAGLDPNSIRPDDLIKFPLMTKKDLMADQDRFLSLRSSPTDRVPNATGGSSGIWFKFFVDRSALDRRTGNALRGACWTGWRPGEKQAVLWGHPRDNQAARSARSRIVSTLVHRSITLNAYNMDDQVLAEFASRIIRWRPTMIRGYASALAFFADYMIRKERNISGISGMISSAETLTDDYRASIESCFSCKLLNRYGSREFADIAQQCELVDGLHIFSDRLHVEILDPEGKPCPPGQQGEIVITDLENRVMPFIRYRTGDLGWKVEGVCNCGRGLPLLGAVEGRTSELIVGKNGKYYSSQSPRLFGADIPGIGQMQIIQDSLQDLKIKIVPDDRWTDDSEQQLRAHMESLLGDIELQILLVDHIPLAPSGKFQFTSSKVSPFTH